MPIYEYSCNECNHKFSHLHKRLGEPPPPCPKCNSDNIKKAFSTFSASSKSSASSCQQAARCPIAQGSSGHPSCAGCCPHKH
ncbi:MAG: zinc ribbon domain-containing protein [Lentisphaerae bacterium]|nr:zinc ribbon domain-containing protein [Lentisphaerota bacterium]